MPFTVSPSSYKGGDYLFQGISNAANSMTEALQKYADDKARVGMSDTIMDYAQSVPGAVSPEALKKYHEANAKEKAYIAMGATSNLKNLFGQQAQEWQNRTNAAHANYYQQAARNQAAEAEAGGAGAGRGKVWSDELGGYATPAQAARAQKLTPEGQIQSNYGLTTQDIFNSKIHEAGTAAKDPSTGATTFTPADKGDQIRIGGEKGVVMPRAEHEVYKRQLEQRGYDPATGARAGPAAAGTGGAGGPAAAGQDPKQAQAIAILQQNGKPLTTGNINYVIQQLGGGQ